MARLKLFYKIDSKLIPLLVPDDLQPKANNGRMDNGKAYVHFASHSNPFFSSFYPKTVRDWNGLSNECVHAPSLGAFANRIKESIG